MIDWYYDVSIDREGDRGRTGQHHGERVGLRECDIGMYYYFMTLNHDTKELRMIPEDAKRFLPYHIT